MEESFYMERGLPVPEHEYWPADRGELARRIQEPSSSDLARVVLGGGHHLRVGALGERRFEVVRTGSVDAIRALDTESGTVRVEAGCRWGDLRERLRGEGLSLQRYAPRAADATIGGLLARRRPTSWEFRDGGLRGHCVALAATSPARGDYDYLPAPRKATGPDHRFLYIGGEGALGVILEATLVVWPSQPGRLVRWETETLDEACEARVEMDRLDVPAVWCHWSRAEQTLHAALRAPRRLLGAYVDVLESAHGSSLEVVGETELRDARSEIEEDHPESRARSEADEAVRIEAGLDDLADAVDAVAGETSAVDVFDWTPRRAVAVVGEAEPDSVPARVLDVERIAGRDEVVWPAWCQRLKARLDPEDHLAVGP